MISKSTKHNPNYLAKIIQVKNLRKHENADRLMVFTIDGNDVITSNQTEEGTVCIYFPLECAINTDYLRANNEFRHKELNADPEKVGFFDDKGRVKAVKLRGQKSEGYISPIDSLEPLIGDKWEDLVFYIGQEFDTVEGHLLVKKYVVKNQEGSGLVKERNAKIKSSKIIDKQFNLHYDTSQLGKNTHKIKPNDIVSISWKLHGTSFVSSKILCKRPLKWWEKALQYIGVRIADTEYGNVYSSRKVIKNDKLYENKNHYYGYDLWSDINDIFKDNLHNGETIYGEAVGYTKDGAAIQKGYDYGCQANKFEVYVYRITQTNTEGKVIDLPLNMVQERCVQLGVNSVPGIYFGPANEFLPNTYVHVISGSEVEIKNISDEEWQEKFLAHLKQEYVYDQDCQFCANKVPAEGIVVRKEGLKPEAFKLKAFRFLEGESKALDKGETNIEDEQGAEETTA